MPNAAARLIVLTGLSLCCLSAYSQGDTIGVDLRGIGVLLMQITIYPVIGVFLAYLMFNISGKAWVFFLAPVIYWGLSIFAPIDPTFTPEDSPPVFSAAGAWFYWTHVVAIAIVFHWFRRKKKAWLFFLAPVIGWCIQLLGVVTFMIAQ